ncbi:cell wall-associated NlpC family hydrolase [Paenibacillus phyllosphaerae]|uniref:Cell wall-associated NlpC family hydrolase n=1 Tax=Paenibacillus phyllosphaerae TaxID=274593 RepID=A0A7W5FNA9_9BACL|nr:NlpC/P60 family protein [Paenibacillus phyllosphaerae]MBB3111146.1 cell wall-associated NlpC family hydrolase [Paenibacillus phyllosphaerae]
MKWKAIGVMSVCSVLLVSCSGGQERAAQRQEASQQYARSLVQDRLNVTPNQTRQPNESRMQPMQTQNQAQIRTNQAGGGNGFQALAVANGEKIQVTPLMRDGEVWIPLEQIANHYDYNYDWDADDKKVTIGETDVLFELEVDSYNAKNGDNTITLHKPPVLQNNQVYLEISSFAQLWQTQAAWDEASQSVVISPKVDTPSPGKPPVTTTPDTGTDTGTGDGTGAGDAGTGEGTQAAQGKAGEVITFAKKFMGTPYLWAAGPYETTKKFDCSSYMQYIYKHIGIKLPRSSRAQSTVGQLVARDALQPGDIVFFYTPGRYTSNKIVGHVGMYIGNNQVIHTTNKPGVTIAPLNGSLEKRYLWSRRVIQ